MKALIHISNIIFIALFFLAGIKPAVAQTYKPGDGLHTWPDSLAMTTWTGTIVVDDSGVHPNYFLDDDGDEIADFNVTFGPWWYLPQGAAAYPEDGDAVTIVGVLKEGSDPVGLTNIIVFELNGISWRIPVEYGRTGWIGEPAWGDAADTLSASGVVLVDTTYFYTHYYLDTDGDTLPEYRLGFGPAWYVPESGAARPGAGDEVDVLGILHEGAGLDLLTVVKLNDEVWRTLDDMAPWAGSWMNRIRQDSMFVYCANNRLTWVHFPPGNFGSGMNGANWPDSVFVQLWEIHPDSLPVPMREGTFIGYHVNVQDRDRDRLMDGRYGDSEGQMRFERAHQVRINYLEEDLEAQSLIESTIGVLTWDEMLQAWQDVDNMVLDTDANLLTFETNELHDYYALAASPENVAIEESDASLPRQVILHANYPNPFNPSTTIAYELPGEQHVVIEVFDIMGRRVAELVNGVRAAGRHRVTFNADDLASGVFVYQLKTESETLKGKMILTK